MTSGITELSLLEAEAHRSTMGFIPTHQVVISLPLGMHQDILTRILEARDWIEANVASRHYSRPPVYYFEDDAVALQFFLMFG